MLMRCERLFCLFYICINLIHSLYIKPPKQNKTQLDTFTFAHKVCVTNEISNASNETRFFSPKGTNLVRDTSII